MSVISRIFIENTDFLKNFLMNLLKSEQGVEDIVHDVYIKAYRAEQTQKISHPKAFLFAVARNLALNELNKSSRKLTSYLEECSPEECKEESETLESEAEADASVELYCRAVSELPDKIRQAVLLRKVHGLKHKEIAKQMGISLSSVEKHLKVGAASCRDYLLRHESDVYETTKMSSSEGGERAS